MLVANEFYSFRELVANKRLIYGRGSKKPGDKLITREIIPYYNPYKLVTEPLSYNSI